MPELELLRRLAPPATPPSGEARAAARAALLRRARPRRRPRWLVAAPPALAGVAAAAVLLLGGSAEGPSPAAAAVLRRAAAAARDVAPTRPLGPGQYLYTRSVDAYLTVVAGRHPFAALVPHTRESWLGADGNGWLTARAGAPIWLRAGDRQAWIAAGRPNYFADSINGPLRHANPAVSLSSDPDRLWRQLLAHAPGPDYPEMFTEVGDALRETYTTPAQRAALYEVAARLPGVRLVGRTTDGVGRPGVAVAIDDPRSHQSDELIFDPATGALLGEEQRALAGSSAPPPVGTTYHLPAGTRLGWAAYLRSEVVDRIRERP
jgi:hypothetical protein